MPFDITMLRDQQPTGTLVADRRLYLDTTRDQMLEHGDTRAAFLLVGEGGTVPAAEVERLGLVMRDGRIQQRPEKETKQEPPPEDKKLEPPEDKSVWKPKKKRAKKAKKKGG